MMEKSKSVWKECVKWLVRCEVLRSDHQTCLPEANVEDLAYTLRDGVLLCRLVNTLEPDCINMDKVNLNPQTTKCLCVQNISIFLKACGDVFSIKDHDLFEPTVLYDLSQFHKVLNTLSQLSNTPKALQRTPFGFSVRLSGINEILIREIDQRRSFELSENASVSTQRESIRQDAIYEKLMLIKRQDFSGSTARRKEKRDYIIEEILTNEESYLHGVLRTVLNSFMKPLKNVLGQYDIRAIFGTIELLTGFHEHFYEDLLKSMKPDKNICVGDVFLKYYGEFLMYGEYIANLPAALELLKSTTRERVEVKYKLDECQVAVKNGRFFLADMLVVPMQHVLKYRLLLDRLLKETKEDHPEHSVLQRAHENMIDVNNYVNDVKRDREALQTIEKIEGKIVDINIPGNKTLKDFGHLHKDDELRIKFQDHKIGNRYVFVFDHVMLICKCLKDGSYACQEVLQLSRYKVTDSAVQGNTRWGYQWILSNKTDDIVYTIFARNEEHKRAWIKAVGEALDNIQPSNANEKCHTFNIHSFQKPTLCNVCNKSLKGLIMQGYICQYCGMQAHKSCLKDVDVCNIVHLYPIHPDDISPHPNDINIWSDYQFLNQYEWFAGIMQRSNAEELLQKHERGTFLVRISPKFRQHPFEKSGQTEYVISMKTIKSIIHMIVYKRYEKGLQLYCLSDVRLFTTIVNLVDYYKQCSLQENFEEYNEFLSHPIRVQENDGDVPSEGTRRTRQEDGGEESDDYLEVGEIEDKFGNRGSSVNTLPQSNIPVSLVTTEPRDKEILGPVTKSADRFGNSIPVNNRSVEEKSRSLSNGIQDDRIMYGNPPPMQTAGALSPGSPQHPNSTQELAAPSPEPPLLGHARIDDEDIQQFGEYVVAALRLIKNPNNFRELTKQIRRIINDKLNDES